MSERIGEYRLIATRVTITQELLATLLGDPRQGAPRSWLPAVHFDGTRFSGSVNFRGAHFSGDAFFADAQFSGSASFGEAQFSGDASVHCRGREGSTDTPARRSGRRLARTRPDACVSS